MPTAVSLAPGRVFGSCMDSDTLVTQPERSHPEAPDSCPRGLQLAEDSALAVGITV